MADYYEIRHTVGFEETNLVGNVYYVNYLRWQGRCREMFLKEKAPAVLDDLRDDLKLFTLKAECEFFTELGAFDELSVRMRLDELTQSQVQFSFDYVRLGDDGEENLVARGIQRIVCMRGPNTATAPTRVPLQLRRALEPYTDERVAARAGLAVLPAQRRDEVARVRQAARDAVAALPHEPGPPAPDGLSEASLRDVMSRFATGITILTVAGGSGHGMTANAFTSVSLDPPLVLCCVARSARMHDAIVKAGQFGISVLGSEQEHLARYFTDKTRPAGASQFDAVGWLPGPRTGAPLLSGALAWLECDLHDVYDGGDHSIFLGDVRGSFRGEVADGAEALLFYGGAFRTGASLGLAARPGAGAPG